MCSCFIVMEKTFTSLFSLLLWFQWLKMPNYGSIIIGLFLLISMHWHVMTCLISEPYKFAHKTGVWTKKNVIWLSIFEMGLQLLENWLKWIQREQINLSSWTNCTFISDLRHFTLLCTDKLRMSELTVIFSGPTKICQIILICCKNANFHV